MAEGFITRRGAAGTLTPPPITYLSFDGVDDYLDLGTLGNFLSQNGTDFSYEITFDNLGSGGFFGFLNPGSTEVWELYHNVQSEDFIATVFDNERREDRIDIRNANLQTGINTIKVEYKNNELNFYTNGVLQNRSIENNDNVFNFGNIETSLYLGSISLGSFVSLDLYDFKLYAGNTLFLHYDMSEGSGNTLIDKVGNNDGTIVGATWVQE